MILVRMGEDEPSQPVPPLLDEADVGQDDVGARQAVVGEGRCRDRPCSQLSPSP